MLEIPKFAWFSGDPPQYQRDRKIENSTPYGGRV